MSEIIKHFFEQYKDYSYVIIYFWMLFTAIFPVSVFVYSEYFFVPAWILVWTWILDIYLVYIFTILWVYSWDLISFFTWRKLWRKVFNKDSKYLSLENLKKWEDFLNKHWNKAIFLSKVIPVIPWMAAFLIWTWNMTFKKFAFYDLIAVIIVFFIIYSFLISWVSIFT